MNRAGLPAFVLLGGLALNAMVHAQASSAPVRVDTAVALKQVIKRVEPALPVKLVSVNPGAVLAADIVVRANGTVESIVVVSSPQGLETPLEAALKQWTFKPFVINGRPARVVTMIDIALPDPAQEADRQAYNDYTQGRATCERALATNASDVELVCRKIAVAGDRLTPSRFLERAHAFELHGRSLAAMGQNAEALKRFEQAVAAQRQGLRREGVSEDSDADLATAIALIAETHIRMKNLKAADEQFASAIAMFERAMVAVPGLRENYSKRLAGVLQRAAELKRTLGLAAEAKALEGRATRLSR